MMVAVAFPGAAQAQCSGSTCTVNSASDLITAITTVDNNPGTSYTINIDSSITLNASTTLPAINTTSALTINGGNNTLNGGDVQRGFFVYAGTVAIDNITIENTQALGGTGGTGTGSAGSGAGGLGAGGALFVASGGNVTVSNVAFTGNNATGGAGETGAAGAAGSAGIGGGGGGMGGSGGGPGGGDIGGGGGGVGLGANGGTGTAGAAGIILNAGSGGAGSSFGPFTGHSGGAGGGGGGGGAVGGGGGVNGANGSAGGAGGFGGGAAGGTANGGGFGGGGGGGNGGSGGNAASGSTGGFGGGGGGGGGFGSGGAFSGATGAAGGFAGGTGGTGGSAVASGGGGGGGGGGLGGAIFVQQGGSLTIAGALSVDGNTVASGAGGGGGAPAAGGAVGTSGSSGTAFGSGIFFQGTDGTSTTLNFGAGNQSIGDVIADYIGSGGTNPSGGTDAADQGGSLALAKSGGGTLTLSSANTYSGGTTLSSGTISFGTSSTGSPGALTSGPLGTGALAMAAGTTLIFGGAGLTIGNAITVTGDPTYVSNAPSSNPDIISGTISNATGGAPVGAVVVDGGGYIALTGVNTYSGGTTICGVARDTACASANGSPTTPTTLIVNNSTPGTSSSIATGALTFDGGTLQVQAGAGPLSFNNAVAVNATDGTFDTNGQSLTWTGAITNGGGATTGTLTIISSTAGGTLTLSPASAAANTYSGATNIGDGTNGVTLQGGILNAFSANSAVTVNTNATLDLGGFSQTIGSLAGTGTVTNNGSNNAVLIAGGNNASTTFSGVIRDGATNTTSLLKTGNGTLSLSGANTYSGGTAVGGGTLNVGSNTALGSGSVVMDNGTTLQKGNAGTAVTLNNAFVLNGAASVVTFDTNNDTAAALIINGVISGAGSLNKAATNGNLALTKTESYTGATTVGGGRLSLRGNGSIAASSGASLSGNAALDISEITTGTTSIQSLSGSASTTVFLGGSGIVLTNASGTFAGVMEDGSNQNGYSGPTTGGSLTVAGGTETLTGTNTYSGPTTINGGATLALSGSGSIASSSVTDNGTFSIAGLSFGTTITSLSGSGVVTLGANGLQLSSASGAFSGAIGGSGGLTLNGGTETLSGTNTYSGPTAITGGTLKLSGTGSIGSSSFVLLATGATFDISGLTNGGSSIVSLGNTAVTGQTGSVVLGGNTLTLSDPSTAFAGVISGSGALAQSAGIETLTGANTYSGGTQLNSGTLLVGNNAALGTGTLAMAAGTTLEFLSGNFTLPNAISITGDPNFAPPSGTTQTLSGVIANGASPGTLDMNGFGTLMLSASNTYTGPTNVTAGTLDVTGSIASSSLTTVASGATLTGTGTIGNLQINGGGTFAPGAGTPGTTMAVAGNLAFASGASYQVFFNPTASTSATVSGAASLAGTVNASWAAGSYISKQYTILTAGSVSGMFSGLSNSNLPANFSTSLAYDSAHAYLDLTLNFTPPGPTPPVFTPLNGNQTNVATTLVNYFNSTGGIPTKFGTLSSSGLTQVDGEDATGAERGAFELTNEFLSLMLDPFVYGRGGPASGGGPLGFAPDQDASFPPDVALAYAGLLKAPPKPPASWDQRWTVWGASFGGSGIANGDPAAGSNNVTTSTYGFAAGADYHVRPDTVLGFALAGSGTNWNLAQSLGTGRSDAFQAGVYGTRYFGPAYVGAALAFTNNWFTTNRAALGDQLTAKFQGQSYGARLESGYRYAVAPAAGVTPYAAIQAQNFSTPAYSETDLTGGGFGLSYNAMNAADTRSELGARFDALTAWGALPVQFRARLAWAHDWVSDPALDASFQALPGTSFVVGGAPVPHDSALTSLGAELHLTQRWTLLGKFDGEFASASQIYAGSGTLRYAW